MAETLQNIGLEQIKKFLPPGETVHLGDDLFMIDVNLASGEGFLHYPFRVDAFLAIFCQKGGFDMEFNLRKYHIEDNTLMIFIPGNILKFETGGPPVDPGRFVAFAVSRSFISSLHFDFARILDSRVMFFQDPRIPLGQEELFYCSHYFHLLREIISSGIDSREAAVESLAVSLMHVLTGLFRKNSIRQSTENLSESRLNNLFERFMALVSEYHTKERDMAFYAGKLGMTPKYLSRLIKQVSGRSAPDWIDSFVVQEAKSMLKYTDDSIKEIIYKLNFSNASVFYKFFKAQTGMTPREFRNA